MQQVSLLMKADYRVQVNRFDDNGDNNMKGSCLKRETHGFPLLRLRADSTPFHSVLHILVGK
jgi:hypothetical protein